MKRSSDAFACPVPKQQPHKIKATAESGKAKGKQKHAIRSSAPHDAVRIDTENMPPPGKKASRAAAATLRRRMKDAKVNALGSPFKYIPRHKRDGEKDKDRDSDEKKSRKGPRPRKRVEVEVAGADADAAPGAPHATVGRGRDKEAMCLGFQGKNPSPGYDSRVSLVEAHQLMRKLEAIQLAPSVAKRTRSVVQLSRNTAGQQQKKTGHRPPPLEVQDSNRNFKDSEVETAAPALDNFAIGNILKECNPNDYKAFMWKRAAKLNKSNDPKDVLKGQTWLSMNARGARKQNLSINGPVFEQLAQMTEGGGERADNGRGSKDRFEKVRTAHRRLQDAMYGDILAEKTAE